MNLVTQMDGTPPGDRCMYLRDGLHRADVSVRPEQDVLQLRLLLVDALHGQTLLILLRLAEDLVLEQHLGKH